MTYLADEASRRPDLSLVRRQLETLTTVLERQEGVLNEHIRASAAQNLSTMPPQLLPRRRPCDTAEDTTKRKAFTMVNRSKGGVQEELLTRA